MTMSSTEIAAEILAAKREYMSGKDELATFAARIATCGQELSTIDTKLSAALKTESALLSDFVVVAGKKPMGIMADLKMLAAWIGAL